MNLKDFHVTAIQEALRTAGILYENPNGIWSAATQDAYRFYCTSYEPALYPSAQHIEQPSNLGSLPVSLINLAGLGTELTSELGFTPEGVVTSVLGDIPEPLVAEDAEGEPQINHPEVIQEHVEQSQEEQEHQEETEPEEKQEEVEQTPPDEAPEEKQE